MSTKHYIIGRTKPASKALQRDSETLFDIMSVESSFAMSTSITLPPFKVRASNFPIRWVETVLNGDVHLTKEKPVSPPTHLRSTQGTN